MERTRFCQEVEGGEAREEGRRRGRLVFRGRPQPHSPSGMQGCGLAADAPHSLRRSPDPISAPTLGTPASVSELVTHTFPPQESPGLGS